MKSTSIPVRVILITLFSFGLYASFEFYRVCMANEELKQDIQGMDEYEVCQYAANEFDMEMVKKMGCLDS